MGSNYKKLGYFIEEVDKRNLDGSVSKLLGLSIKKYFTKTKANLEEIDLKNYKIVAPNQFAWRAIDVGRDGMSIALSFFEKNILISPAYIVFKVKDIKELDPYYLFLFLRKREFERYSKYHAWGSIRETFDWEHLCNFLLPVISIEKQRQFINELSGLDKQIQVRKKFSEKLKVLLYSCKRYFYDSKCIEPLGKNIKLVSRKNKDNLISNLIGISGEKRVVDYGGTIKGEDFSKFKVIQKNEFVWSPDIAKLCALTCWTEDRPALISSAYQVFSIVDKKILSLGYLMACFFDPQFDRYATYHSWGSNRDKFKPLQLFNFRVSLIDSEIQTLFTYLHKLLLINQKIISLAEKRRAIVLENFEYLLQD